MNMPDPPTVDLLRGQQLVFLRNRVDPDFPEQDQPDRLHLLVLRIGPEALKVVVIRRPQEKAVVFGGFAPFPVEHQLEEPALNERGEHREHKHPSHNGQEQFGFHEDEHRGNHAPQCQSSKIPHVDQRRRRVELQEGQSGTQYACGHQGQFLDVVRQERDFQPRRKIDVAADVRDCAHKQRAGHQGHRRQRIHAVRQVHRVCASHDDEKHERDEKVAGQVGIPVLERDKRNHKVAVDVNVEVESEHHHQGDGEFRCKPVASADAIGLLAVGIPLCRPGFNPPTMPHLRQVIDRSDESEAGQDHHQRHHILVEMPPQQNRADDRQNEYPPSHDWRSAGVGLDS